MNYDIGASVKAAAAVANRRNLYLRTTPTGTGGPARRVPRRSGAPPLGGRGGRGGLRSLRARPERESHATRVDGGAATPRPFPARTRDGHCMHTAPASAAQTLLAPTTTGLSVSPFTGLRAPNIVELS